MYRQFIFPIFALLVLTSSAMAQIDPATVTTGHVYLLEDVAGGQVPDDSANNNTGIIVGDPQVVPGLKGNALQFDGIDDGVDIPDSDFINVNAGPWPNRTVVAVFKCDDVTKSDKQTVFEEGGTTRGLTIYVHEGLVYGAAWNRAEYNWDGAWLSAPIESGTWHGVAIIIRDGGDAVEDDKFEMWMDGRLIAKAPGGQIYNHGNDNAIGYTNQNNVFHDGNASPADGHYFAGAIDEVWILNEALTEAQLGGFAGKPWPFAFSPSPKDGSIVEATWTSLTWNPGGFAVSHDVYISNNFDDVNSGAEATFVGNQSTTELVIGFPGFPYPDGLVPGTTYYWRIDEVNEAEPNSPWKGDVWSFSIPPNTAYAPVPADGAKFIEPDVTLSWTGGFEAKLHTVYFGDNFDDVNNTAGGPLVADTTFTPPGPLEADKIYYWRVDEFNPPTTYKGDVWSFQVAKEGGGVKGEYFKGMNFENLVLTRIDPQIDFDWGNPGGPDPVVGDDQFSARWTGQVEAVFTETYTFYTNSDDGVRLWVDGKRIINNWTNHANTENSGEIDLVAGQTYSIVMEYYEDGGGAVAQLRWSSPRTPKQLVPAGALSLLTKAHTPSPPNGNIGVKLVTNLTWKPGEFAASHDVYLGTDADAVANATTASPEYKGSKQLGDESLDPGKLAIDTTYYWRVDEVNNPNPGSPWAGNIWSFNTGGFLVVDDFESYNDIDPPAEGSSRIFDIWIDGFGTTDNGALVGNDLPPYAEQTIVNGGFQSMIYRYDNAGKTSEATMTLVWPRDWTEEGVTKLSLMFRGASSNAADRMFVALGNAVVYHDNPAATQMTGWNEWIIDLAAFAGVDLTNVNTITIGIGTRGTPAVDGGTGTMYFDDIRLCR